jgi:cell division protein FtsQ
MEAALWVGKRRWDLRMKSGETISLPEGPAAEAALMRFADMNRQTPLLGRGFVRFDLRLPDKMVVRVGGEPGQPVKPRPEPSPPAAPPVAAAPATPESQPMQTARLAAPKPQEATI